MEHTFPKRKPIYDGRELCGRCSIARSLHKRDLCPHGMTNYACFVSKTAEPKRAEKKQEEE